MRREVQEEEAILQDLKIESELHARWTTDSQDQEKEQEYQHFSISVILLNHP